MPSARRCHLPAHRLELCSSLSSTWGRADQHSSHDSNRVWGVLFCVPNETPKPASASLQLRIALALDTTAGHPRRDGYHPACHNSFPSAGAWPHDLSRRTANVGGGESAATARKRHLRWREQNPKAYRRMRAKQKRRYYRQFQKNNRSKGKRWTPVEIERITAKNRPTDRELSKTLGRSVQAIQRRRSRVP
jgi:hypothetical protein